MSDGYIPPGGGDPYTQQMLDYIMAISQQGAQPLLANEDVAAAQRRMNLGQDWLSVQADQSNSAFAGPGAYGPNAFDPTTTYTPVDQPGRQQLMAYAARPDTPQGIIALGILQGSTASAEIAKLQAAYNKAIASGADPSMDPILSQIPMGPPDQYSGAIAPDWVGLSMTMQPVETAFMSESQGAQNTALYDDQGNLLSAGGNRQVVYDANGQPVLADVESTPSESAQWYIDQGLSLPTDEYQTTDLLGPDYQGSPEQTDAMRQALISLLQNDPSIAPPTTGKDAYAPVPASFDKAGQPTQNAGAPNQGGADYSLWEKLKSVFPAPEMTAVDSSGGAAPNIGKWYLDNLQAPIAQGIDTGTDWMAGQWQKLIDAIAGGDNGGMLTDPATGPRPVEEGQGPLGFGGGGGLAALDPQTAAMISLMASSMLHPMGGQPPQPPGTGGSGAITNEPTNQGYGVNGTPPPTPAAAASTTPVPVSEDDMAPRYDPLSSAPPVSQTQTANRTGVANAPPQSEQLGRGTQVTGMGIYGQDASPLSLRLGTAPIVHGQDPNLSPMELAMARTARGNPPYPFPDMGTPAITPLGGNPTMTESTDAARAQMAQLLLAQQPAATNGPLGGTTPWWTAPGGQPGDTPGPPPVGYPNQTLTASTTTPYRPEDQWWYNDQMEPSGSSNMGPTQTAEEGSADARAEIARKALAQQAVDEIQAQRHAQWLAEHVRLGGNLNAFGVGAPPYQNDTQTGGQVGGRIGRDVNAQTGGNVGGRVGRSNNAPTGGRVGGTLPWWSQIGGNQAPARVPGSERQKASGKTQQRTQRAPQRGNAPKPYRGLDPNGGSAERANWFRQTQAVLDAQAADRRNNYGYDYGRAAAAAYLLRQSGIRPLDTQIAARRAAAGQIGV